MNRRELRQLYIGKKMSASAIAQKYKCSEGRVNYWLAKYRIPKRSIPDAIYQMWNPSGDPFSVRKPRTVEEGILYGIGVGLYWGEGTKANKHSVRLGNSDPRLIATFIEYLTSFYKIEKRRLRFGLQIFGDMNPRRALRFWTEHLAISRKQFLPKIVIAPHRGVGSYRKKTEHGVLTLYFNNRKLRDIICAAIDEQSMKPR